jgi:hypothetical protein
MQLDLTDINGTYIAEVISDQIEINHVQDAVDLLGNCRYQSAESIIINERNITPDFFDLKTGIAGEVLQKFSNYNMRLAIVGEFSKYDSKSLQDFIYESNKTGSINFVNSVNQAKEQLAR